MNAETDYPHTCTIHTNIGQASAFCALEAELVGDGQPDHLIYSRAALSALTLSSHSPTSMPAPPHLTLFIQQVQDAQFGLYEVDTGLVVIEIDQGPRDLLLHVFFLLQLEDVLEEEVRDQS